jgi:hypothetical protein
MNGTFSPGVAGKAYFSKAYFSRAYFRVSGAK